MAVLNVERADYFKLAMDFLCDLEKECKGKKVVQGDAVCPICGNKVNYTYGESGIYKALVFYCKTPNCLSYGIDEYRIPDPTPNAKVED